MSRRSGQCGYVERKGNAYYVRYWCDVVGQEKRVHKSVRLCPVSGPGKLNQRQREHKAREIIIASGADSAEHFQRVQAANLGTTFRQQSETWLREARQEQKPATLTSWRSHLKYINAHIGDAAVADVNNGILKELVTQMAADGFRPKTQRNYATVVKTVVASAVDKDGNALHPRTWNHKFVRLPKVHHAEQHTPMLTSAQISELLTQATGSTRVLYALLAASGLRIGEALALEVSDISADGQTITVRQSAWNGQVQAPKTPNACRQVDVHPRIATMLVNHIGKRQSGFLFPAENGKPLRQSNVLRRSLHPLLQSIGLKDTVGFHALRRFRATQLRKYAPENLVRYWLGHSTKSVTDLYDKTHEDVAYRRSIARGVPLGFNLPVEIPSENTDTVPICTQGTFLQAMATA